MVTVAEFTPSMTPETSFKATSLMEETPPVIVRVLSIGYPLFQAADRLFGVLTWTSSDRYQSLLLLLLYIITVRNFEKLVINWLPLLLAVSIGLLLNDMQKRSEAPTLDEVVRVLDRAGRKYRRFISPLKSTHVSGPELIRFVLASSVLSPVYLLISWYLVSFRTLVLVFGCIVLSWHSLWFRVARSVAWRSPFVRYLSFIVTGIDRTGLKQQQHKAHEAHEASIAEKSGATTPRDVTFTFVVLENQRHWLGIGWTPNLLPEERAPFTDPLLNEVSPIDSFKLPIAEGSELAWTWLDSMWMLDLSNNNLLPTSELTSSPKPDDGFVYFNNMWSSPSATPTFSKYTRSRRWVRKAALASVAVLASERLVNDGIKQRNVN